MDSLRFVALEIQSAARRTLIDQQAESTRAASAAKTVVTIGGVLALPLDAFADRLGRAATELGIEPPTMLEIEGWWDQARTLEEE